MEQTTQRCGRCKVTKPTDDFNPSQRGIPGRWCKACLRADYLNHREVRIAAVAARKLAARGGHVQVRCARCGAEFTTTPNDVAKRNRRFCSYACKDRAHKDTVIAARLAAKPDRWCAWCGAKLERSKRSDAYYCTDQCLNDAHVATANFRRRAQDTKMRTEPRFSMFTLGERDGWTCGICGGPLDRTLRYPDGMMISFDHIVPIAKGGAHLAPSNLRLAHLDCNVKRGAR